MKKTLEILKEYSADSGVDGEFEVYLLLDDYLHFEYSVGRFKCEIEIEAEPYFLEYAKSMMDVVINDSINYENEMREAEMDRLWNEHKETGKDFWELYNV